MRPSSILAALSLAAVSYAQAVPEGIAPDEPSPEGCEQTAKGNFTIGIMNLAAKTKRESVTEAADNTFICTLEDGILHDPYGRTGAIVANYQFQFDGPPQAGSIYTGGFSVCENNTLAIGGSTLFYRCMSGEFGNLYDRSIGDQCREVNIAVQYVEEPSSSSSSSSVASSTATTASASSSGSASASASASTTGLASSSMTTETPSGSASASATSVTEPPSAPEAANTGGALPKRVPRRETFGAVIGILGAALIL